MSINYQRLDDDDHSQEYPERPEFYFMQMSRHRELRWPRAIGIVQVVVGIVLAFLGLLEVFVIPMSDNHTATVQFNKNTCYGVGIYAGFVMVLSGSMAVRASLSKRRTSVYKFYNLTVLTLLVYFGLSIFLIVAYSKGWTTESAYPKNSHMYQVHMFVTILTVLGLMFAVAAVVQYYDAVCCGEVALWQWWTRCLCAICLAQTRTQTRQESDSDVSVASSPNGALLI